MFPGLGVSHLKPAGGAELVQFCSVDWEEQKRGLCIFPVFGAHHLGRALTTASHYSEKAGCLISQHADLQVCRGGVSWGLRPHPTLIIFPSSHHRATSHCSLWFLSTVTPPPPQEVPFSCKEI